MPSTSGIGQENFSQISDPTEPNTDCFEFALLRIHYIYELKAVTCRFVPPLRGLLFLHRFEKYTVTPTSNKKFSTRNPAVFL